MYMKKWIRLFSLAFVAILVNIGSNRHFDKFSYSQTKEHYLWQNHHKLVHFLAFSKTWRDSLILDSIPAQELLAIVYPEILRHSASQDTFETQIMQALYIPYGTEEADFSLGYFQMKASFCEQIEQYLQKEKVLFPHFQPLYQYQNTDSVIIRSKRLERMLDPAWSLQYLQAFYQIVLYRFPHLRNLPPEERIRFLATAYNRGFLCSEAEIKRFYSIKLYPYGAGKLKKYYYGKRNFCSYSELAVYGFQNSLSQEQ